MRLEPIAKIVSANPNHFQTGFGAVLFAEPRDNGSLSSNELLPGIVVITGKHSKSDKTFSSAVASEYITHCPDHITGFFESINNFTDFSISSSVGDTLDSLGDL